MRRFGGVVVVLCLPALAPAAVAAAPPLAPTTVVEASTPAYMDVEVREPFNLFGRRGTPYEIVSAGKVVILSLRSFDRVGMFGRDNLEIMRLGDSTSMSGTFTCPCSEPPGEVQAGRYRLYLQSDAPAEVTIRTTEGDRSATLRPTVPVPFASAPLISYPTIPDTAVLGAWGDQLSGGAVMHLYAKFSGASSRTVDHVETCLLYAEDEQKGDDAFQPGCSGPANFAYDVQPLASGGWSVYSSAYNFPAGRY